MSTHDGQDLDEAGRAQFELTRTCLRGRLEAAAQEVHKLSGNCRAAASS